MKKKIYIAGKLNASAVEYIKNIHRMLGYARTIRKMGFSVYVPAIDILLGIFEGDLEYSDYFENSQPWLMVSDAIFVVPGWEGSEGVKREIETAKELEIPIFYDFIALINELHS